MGWPLGFTPISEQPVNEVELRVRADDKCCWFTAVDDGVEPIGFLTIRQPPDERMVGAFPSVCDFAEMTADLLCRLLQLHRSIETRNSEMTTLVNIGRTVQNETNLNDAVQHLLDASIRLTGFRQAAFFLLNSKATRLTARAVSGLSPFRIPHRVRTLEQLPPDVESLAIGQSC